MKRSILCLVVCVLLFASSGLAVIGTFEYDEITDPIISATFFVDAAAMNAHRSVDGNEMNYVKLIDLSTSLPDSDLSDDLFGAASPPDDPVVDMGVLETGIISASIDASFFPALAGGSIGLNALLTDTVDGMFAIDFLSLTIETATEVTEYFYGFPVGSENNGFGIGLADGGDLPDVLPDSIPAGATGTGFDETISSMTIFPEPATLLLLGLGGILLRKRLR